jgi:flavin reductase (DIM6/NTAB) family NADH-FMN oxidoreductase RutF
MPELPRFEPGTVAILSTGGGAPHAIPVSNWIVCGPRVLLALARRRESLARLRREPQVAFTVLAQGVALTAHASARVVVEALAASDEVAAIALDVHAIQDHDQPTFTLDEGVRWHWDDDEAQARDAAIRTELASLVQGA